MQPKMQFLRHRWLAFAMVLLLATTGLAGSAGAAPSDSPLNQIAIVGGNITPHVIQIDTGTNGADLVFQTVPPGANTPTGADVDWVKNSSTPVSPTVYRGTVYDGLGPAAAHASGGTGNWYGVRIVDDVAGNDQDIFLTGGKENDTTTWNVGPGSVGSSKYDITQAYLANNLSYLFFAMERRGNNGTTAFDFEFNQEPPQSDYIPTRTVGDVLFTFEMNGSGNTGSAVPHYFTWNGSAFVEQSIPGTVYISINQVTIPGGPWGFVTSKGDWVLSSASNQLDRFEFAEAAVPFGQGGITLPGVDPCGGHAFVQVRTRSSATATSDLKDTIKIFEYQFGNLIVTPVLTPTCGLDIGYSATAESGGVDVTSQATWSWDFSPNTTPDKPTGASGTVAAPNAGGYTATATASYQGCNVSATTAALPVYAPLAVTVDAVPSCSLTGNAYSSAVTGGSGSVSHAWTGSNVTFSSPTGASGTYDANGSVTNYTLTDTVTDLRTDLPAGTCTANNNDTVALSAFTSTASLTPTCDLTLPFAASTSGGIGTVSTGWSFSGPTAVTPNTTTALSGTANVTGPGGTYTGTFAASDVRTDGSSNSIGSYTCTANKAPTAEVYGPISVSISPSYTSLTCSLPDTDVTSTATTFTAVPSGGKAPYTVSWTVTGDNVAPACANGTTCTVDSAATDYCALMTVKATADDSFPQCNPASSQAWNVSKVTTVTASQAP